MPFLMQPELKPEASRLQYHDTDHQATAALFIHCTRELIVSLKSVPIIHSLVDKWLTYIKYYLMYVLVTNAHLI